MIKILIVDDSDTEIAILKNLIESESDMQVIGIAKNGAEAVKLTTKLKPDLITMDILMPVMDGFEAIRLIMSQTPTPIVVISSKANDEELNTTFKALQAGALSVIEKPTNITSPSFKMTRKHIMDTLRGMAEIKVIRHRFYAKKNHPSPIPSHKFNNHFYELIAIGSSVGGPQALINILSKLPQHFPIPIVVVQHMTKGFIAGFTKWLNDNINLKVKKIENGDIIQKGYVYFGSDDSHFEVYRADGKLMAKLTKSPPIAGFCPSISVLFSSVAKACGKNAVGILLTGMGHDGAQGLLEIKNAKGHTLIQDENSAVVFGMAGVAKDMGAVDKVVELDNLGEYIIELAKGSD